MYKLPHKFPNVLSLIRTFCPTLSEETDLTQSRLLDFTFSKNFSLSKDPYVVEIDVYCDSAQLQQRTNYKIFQEALFWALDSSANL